MVLGGSERRIRVACSVPTKFARLINLPPPTVYVREVHCKLYSYFGYKLWADTRKARFFLSCLLFYSGELVQMLCAKKTCVLRQKGKSVPSVLSPSLPLRDWRALLPTPPPGRCTRTTCLSPPTCHHHPHLNISMRNVLRVEIGQAGQNLPRRVSRLLLGHGPILLQSLAQAPAVEVLQKNVKVLPRLVARVRVGVHARGQRGLHVKGGAGRGKQLLFRSDAK